MINTVISSVLIIFFTISLESIGCKINNYFFKDKKNFHTNLIYGIIFLNFVVLILFNLNLFDIKLVSTFLIIFSFFRIFKFNTLKVLYNFCSENLFLFFLIIIIFLSTFKSLNYSYGDDLSGYFFTISKYINGREVIKANLHENFREYHISSLQLINAIFVYLSNFYSTNFFDRFYGLTLTILIVNNIAKNNKKFFFLLVSLSLLSILSINETASGKFIIVPLTLFLLLKLEDFYYSNDNRAIFQIIFLSFSLVIMKPISIISITNILFILILITKVCKKEISLKFLINSFFIFTIISILYFIHNFNINFSFIPSILIDNQFYYTNNDYAKNIFENLDIKKVFFSFLFIRQNYLIIILTLVYLLFFEKRKKFNFLLLISLLSFQILIWINMYPDNYNQLRYSLPFYQSLFIFIAINFIGSLKTDNLKKYYTIVIIVFFIATRINLNISYNSKLIFNDLLFYFEKESITKKKNDYNFQFIYNKSYQNNLNTILKYSDTKSNNLLLISRPYLIYKDFFNKKNLTYVEQGSGFILSDIPYPIDGSLEEKSDYFEKKNINTFVFEKNIKNNFDKINLNHYSENSHISSVAQKLFYFDLLETVEKINKIKIIENDDFIIWRIIQH
jgi:hypothetical protein